MLRSLGIACSLSVLLFRCTQQLDKGIGTPQWQQKVERQVHSSDNQGHGPDIGSQEWCYVIEFKLFDRKSGLIPCSPEWNQKVNALLIQTN